MRIRLLSALSLVIAFGCDRQELAQPGTGGGDSVLTEDELESGRTSRRSRSAEADGGDGEDTEDTEESSGDALPEGAGGDAPAPQPPKKVDALTELAFANGEGTHVVGGGACVAPAAGFASIADCGGGTCFGNQKLCKATGTVEVGPNAAVASTVVLELMVTQEGAHKVGGGGCPDGFPASASVADCGGGKCFGNQLFCIRTGSVKALQPGQKVLRDVYVTREGTHQPGGGGCPPDFRVVGSVADCGGGTCFGNQVVCVAESVVP